MSRVDVMLESIDDVNETLARQENINIADLLLMNLKIQAEIGKSLAVIADAIDITPEGE